MPTTTLTPRLELLSEDYVLIQAWKKTAAHMRSRNWFADILELDLTEIYIPTFIHNLAKQLREPENWEPDPIRIVLAPKSQPWIQDDGWRPTGACRLRPLAHLTLRDQVAATALMLCLADRVETEQRDPRTEISIATPPESRPISYGNRLFCDKVEHDNSLRHRWGSSKLYRGYYEDYKQFLSRSPLIAKEVTTDEYCKIFVIHTDLKQFYDRVSPKLLASAIKQQLSADCDDGFRTLVYKLFCWTWHECDRDLVEDYADKNKINSFTEVALPQGLVSAGFFANVLLLGLDDFLRDSIDDDITDEIVLVDACRYVDDFRLVVKVNTTDCTADEVSEQIVNWLQSAIEEFEKSLGESESSLLIAEDKLSILEIPHQTKPVVYQSHRMNQIQRAVSGGFGAVDGAGILNSITALISSQRRFESIQDSKPWAWSPVPDTNDGTVKRFAAGRYRRTYRSIRPLLEDAIDPDSNVPEEIPVGLFDGTNKLMPRRSELDHDAKVFAYDLITDWINDASNVRLLRVALDLWPSAELLGHVLNSIHPLIDHKATRSKPECRVAWYCLAEIFSAATFETGHVSDSESLPAEADVDGYRSALYTEALRLCKLKKHMPWYVTNAVLLFLAAYSSREFDSYRNLVRTAHKRYKSLFAFLSTEYQNFKERKFARYLILVRRSFPRYYERIDSLIEPTINTKAIRIIAKHDPSYAIELLDKYPRLYSTLLKTEFYDDLCLGSMISLQDSECLSLADIVTREGRLHRLRSELSLLQFSLKFLNKCSTYEQLEHIRPTEVFVSWHDNGKDIKDIELKSNSDSGTSRVSMYCPPNWCEPVERWRFHLGFLLRYLLTCSPDFTRSRVRNEGYPTSQIYFATPLHWYHRIHGDYHGQVALEDDWLPISNWFEDFLYRLLVWPSSGVVGGVVSNAPETSDHSSTLRSIRSRIRVLEGLRGKSTSVLVLPMSAPFRYKSSTLRACIVQSIYPQSYQLREDCTLSQQKLRRSHRRHLTAALATVDRMLDWRSSHQSGLRDLDLLIFPELAVHTDDIRSYLRTFALKHKVVIIAGVTYRSVVPSSHLGLVNSAVWVVPFRRATGAWDIFTRTQGKQHIAPEEQGAFGSKISGFRPCQWLIDYEWSSSDEDEPARLTASVCYDAMDLGLAADLRQVSDVFIVPAFNKDVDTFDNLAMHLHHNMFQVVVIANSGQYGGSCAFWPRRERFARRIFHCHGNSQAAVGFFDIDLVELLGRMKYENSGNWKSLPAGFR